MPFFAGFDTSIYPGSGVMQDIKNKTNMSWCAYYLAPAPARRDTSWSGARPDLIAQGWGLAPVFLGQQATSYTIGIPSTAHVLTAAQGTIDAASACSISSREGFPLGTFIYLDWEDGGSFTADAVTYVNSWTNGVVAAGYQPGFYCSHLRASDINNILNGINPTPNARIWVWKVPSVVPHPYAGDRVTFSTPDPGAANAVAFAWQYEQECTGAFDSLPGTVDLDTAAASDPGSA